MIRPYREGMTPPATVLLVFGRGVTAGDGGYRLTAESVARTEAAVAYVRAHAEAFRRTPAHGWCSRAAGRTARPVRPARRPDSGRPS